MTEPAQETPKSSASDGVGDVFLTLRGKEYARHLLRATKRLKDEFNVTVTLAKGHSIAEIKEESDAPPTNDDIEAAREDCLSRLDKIFDAPGRKEDRRIASDTLILVLERMTAYKIGQRAINLGLRKVPRSRTKLQRGDTRTEQFADWLATFAATRYQIEPVVPFFVRRKDPSSEPDKEPEDDEVAKSEPSPTTPASGEAAEEKEGAHQDQPSPASEEDREALHSKLNPGAIPFLPNWALPAPKSIVEPTQLLLRGGIPEPVTTAKKRALELLAEYRQATHFVGIHISSAAVREEVRKLQQQLKFRRGDTFVPPVGLHVNLCSLHCFTPEHLEKASRLLHCAQDIFADETDLHFRLRGLRHHKGRVLFVAVDPSAALEQARQRLLGYFRQHAPELVSPTAEANAEVHYPHVTLLKTRNTNTVWQTIEKQQLEEWSKHDFGSETITQLDLCAADEKKKDGYYSVVASVTVVAPPVKRVRSPTSAVSSSTTTTSPQEASDAPLTPADEQELALIDPELDTEVHVAEERKLELPDVGAEPANLPAPISPKVEGTANKGGANVLQFLSKYAPVNQALPPGLEKLPDYQPPQGRQGGQGGRRPHTNNNQRAGGRKQGKPQPQQQQQQQAHEEGNADAGRPTQQQQQEQRQRRTSPAAHAGGQQQAQQQKEQKANAAAAKRKWVVKDA
eukprot:TRINITY_DN4386_c0_g1_i2.p1 TRINITY_DN4386_c0_g1~~TRINITY_DN4386_c0_g1_i2.p1  ORF type:complete len:682 (-),score=156.80 TRINITY_DN4386_c0_g1_i2:889-2934(-)